MIRIAHRGNYKGRNELKENNPQYIDEALDAGYDCEIDVWHMNGKFFLGHDSPTYEVEQLYLQNNKLWCHAKNHEALRLMLSSGIHCFWHEEDAYTITSKGFIWAYPGKPGASGTITVMPEAVEQYDLTQFSGICSDDFSLWADS